MMTLQLISVWPPELSDTFGYSTAVQGAVVIQDKLIVEDNELQGHFDLLAEHIVITLHSN